MGSFRRERSRMLVLRRSGRYCKLDMLKEWKQQIMSSVKLGPLTVRVDDESDSDNVLLSSVISETDPFFFNDHLYPT